MYFPDLVCFQHRTTMKKLAESYKYMCYDKYMRNLYKFWGIGLFYIDLTSSRKSMDT